MDKIFKNYFIVVSMFLTLALTLSSCTEDEIESDADKVVPLISSLNGPELAFQSSTATYSISFFRGGSTYIWEVNGAEMQPIEGRTDKINVYFNQAEEPVSISVKEQAFNGLVSEAVTKDITVICNPQPGDYLVVMHDSYGDGWQTDDGNGGNGITIDIDGDVQEIGMCNPYVDVDYECTTGDYSDAETTVTIPEGTISAVWNFPGDYYGEISFEIYAPDGSLAFESGEPGAFGAGQIPVIVCAD